jgi:hypothetical protein
MTWIQRGPREHLRMTLEMYQGKGVDMPWPQAAEYNMFTNKQRVIGARIVNRVYLEWFKEDDQPQVFGVKRHKWFSFLTMVTCFCIVVDIGSHDQPVVPDADIAKSHLSCVMFSTWIIVESSQEFRDFRCLRDRLNLFELILVY